MLLSDIPVHREQMPQAQFFDPARPDQLADLLEAALAASDMDGPDKTETMVANQTRLAAYGRCYIDIVDDAICRAGA
jgi:hypothetical protein